MSDETHAMIRHLRAAATALERGDEDLTAVVLVTEFGADGAYIQAVTPPYRPVAAVLASAASAWPNLH